MVPRNHIGILIPSCTPFAFCSLLFSRWALTLSYMARAVGIPARVASAPCWNGGDFKGLAVDNPNVTTCWHGGPKNTPGGAYLYNHNWYVVITY